MSAADWSTFSQHIDSLSLDQVYNLRRLTQHHLRSGNTESKACYIKVAFIDNYEGPPEFYNAQGEKIDPPRVVLWETHPDVSGLEGRESNQVMDMQTLRRKASHTLPPELRSLRFDLYFASMDFRNRKPYTEPETIRHYLLSYCDKVYAKPSSHSLNEVWNRYKHYFNQAQKMILDKPDLYTELCYQLREMFLLRLSQKKPISSDKLYSYLVLLRSLPDTLARSTDGYIEAAKSLGALLAFLDLLDTDQLSGDTEVELAHETIYNVINIIEWLTYLIPKMYGVLQAGIGNGSSIYQKIVERLESYIVDEKYALAIRMEAAWALSWASVSSIGVATCVYTYDKSARARVSKLGSAVLRHVVATAYLRAAFMLVSFGPARISPDKLGGYQPEQIPAQISASTLDSARHAAAEIVYSELEKMVDGNIHYLSVFALFSMFWLMTNDLVVTIFLLKAVPTIFLSIMPLLVLFIISTLLTRQWGRVYWKRISIYWIAFILLGIIPWISLFNHQQTLIIINACIAVISTLVGVLSSWASVLSMIFAVSKFLIAKKRPY